MPLIKCPECGKSVSDTRDSCIHCGYKLNQSRTKPSQQKPAKKQGSILGTIFWIIVMVCIFRACSSTTETSTSSTRANSESNVSTIKLKDTDKGFEDYFSKNPTLIKKCQTIYNNKESASSCICKHLVVWFLNGDEQHSAVVEQTLRGRTNDADIKYQKGATEYPALVDNLYGRCYKFSIKRLSNI